MRNLSLSAVMVVGVALVAAQLSVYRASGDPESHASAPSTVPSTGPAMQGLDAIVFAVGGEWRLDGKWANGNPITARAQYTFGPGRRYVVANTHVDDPAKPGDPTFRDIVLYSVDADGRLVQHTFPHNGPPRAVGATTGDDGAIVFEWTQTHPTTGQQTQLRQRITRLDDNRLRWQAMMQIKGEWHTTLDGEWVREAK